MNTAHRQPSRFDAAIVGAGIAGLNALFAAAEYLPKGARVLLVDRRDGAGGMWLSAYPYVRLHQPHPSFTVGDLGWDWRRPPGYLASGGEVAAHLTRCYSELKDRLSVTERFGTECLGIDEVDGPNGPEAELRLAGPGGETEVVRATRAVHAAGVDIPHIAPLDLSSTSVTSTTPAALDLDSAEPVVVVGGGKTGLDTCHAVIKANPERSVTLLQGAGTIFGNRTRALPEGLARYWRGHVLLRSFKEVSTRFDGTNEGDVFAFFRGKYTISLDTPGERFMFGILSEEERDTIRGGLTALLNDYLADVIDDADDGTPVMITRTGERRALQHGTTVVNCTGHVLRHDRPYRPFLSPGGAILTITSRSAGHFLSSVSGYFLGHLFFAGQLQDAPLYEIDLDGARQLGPKLFHVAGTTHTFHNTAVIIGLLPFTVLDRCHLDLDRWFPLHRRLPIFLDVKLNRRRYIDQCRAALDRVRAERGLRCGPLAAA